MRLPVTHCLVTCTLPEARRGLARRPQKSLYPLLLRASSAACQARAWDARCLGGRSALVGGLPPGTRDLRSHPHVHDRATGGGLAAAGHWRPSRPDPLGPVKPLAVLCRAQFRDGRHTTALCPHVDAPVWHKDWIVHCAPVGRGHAALRSLAPALFRVALSTNRLLELADGQGTLQYKASAPAQGNMGTVPAEECMRRLLQHVLPHRCVTVRPDGVLSPGHRQRLTQARALRGAGTSARHTAGKAPQSSPRLAVKAPVDAPRCPTGGPPLLRVHTLRPKRRWPP